MYKNLRNTYKYLIYTKILLIKLIYLEFDILHYKKSIMRYLDDCEWKIIYTFILWSTWKQLQKGNFFVLSSLLDYKIGQTISFTVKYSFEIVCFTCNLHIMCICCSKSIGLHCCLTSIAWIARIAIIIYIILEWGHFSLLITVYK